MSTAYLDQLRDAANAAEHAEAEFRQYAERELEIMTARRARAHRRFHLVNEMVESARRITEKSACIAAQTGTVLAQAGWSENDPGYTEVCNRFQQVAALVYDDLHCAAQLDQPSARVLPSLAAFEAWYCARFGTEFPALVPRDVSAFQPLVDF